MKIRKISAVSPTSSSQSTPAATLPPPRRRPSAAPASDGTRADGSPSIDQGAYEVGYGKPPISTRFKKGQSGNPSGRRKAPQDLATIVRDNLLSPISVRTEDGVGKITRIEAVVRKYLELALKGNQRAGHKLLDLYHLAVPSPDAGESNPSADTPSATDQQILTDYLSSMNQLEA